MKRIAPNSRRGIALVITLIMLSVVTITAVAFLALSRRERGAVAATSDAIDARYLADAGFARARAEAAARILAGQDLHAISLVVSTNFINPQLKPGFSSYFDQADINQLTNVNYLKDPQNGVAYDLSSTADLAAYERMLANLFYDPRPPVFVSTNRSPSFRPDFRFYLDLNRNGRYESNGWVWPTDRLGKTNGYTPEFMVGDPEWIGVLQHPDAPYSGTNLFVGRYAYVIVPDSRTLDINFVHNAVKSSHGVTDGPGNSAFFRNQGVGSWELNLGGFLSDLNTNIWGTNRTPTYAFQTNITRGSSGAALDDAGGVVAYRLAQKPNSLSGVTAFLRKQSGAADPSLAVRMSNDGVDLYSDGPVATSPDQIIHGAGLDTDNPGSPWFGSDQTNYFTDIQQLFMPALGLTSKLQGVWPTNGTPQTSTESTYDNYTFYRLLGQLGVDGGDARFESGVHPAYAYPGNPFGFYRRAKLNLNYAMTNPNGGDATNAEVAGVSGLRDWSPVGWMTNAANRLLLTEFTNGLPMPILDGLGNQARVNPGIPVLGREGVSFGGRRYITNYSYTAQIHRPLQLAANIFDYNSNRVVRGYGYPYLPTVYRPVLYHYGDSPLAFRLAGFTEVTSTNDLNAQWYLPGDGNLFRRLSPVRSRNELPTDTTAQALNVFGIPWVVGAKKGLPSFNEGFWQTALQVTRRLIFVRPTNKSFLTSSESPFTGANGEGFRTFAQYLVNLTNTIGLDAWNSYTNPYPRPVTIYATNYHQFALRTGNPTNGPILLATNYPIPAGVIKLPKWEAKRYVSPLNTNIVYNFIYDPYQSGVYPGSSSNIVTPVSTLLPQWSISITNSMVFAIIDDLTGRFIDVVTLQSRVFETNLFSYLGGTNRQSVSVLRGAGNLPAGGAALSLADYWNPTAAGSYGTVGIQNQFLVSIGARQAGVNDWINALGGPVAANDRTNSILGLNYFLYGTLPTDGATADRIRKSFGERLSVQAGFNPSPAVYLTDRRMANDPLVHYTLDDLRPGYTLFSTSTKAGHYYGPDGVVYPLGGGAAGGATGLGAQLDSTAFTNQIGRQTRTVSAYAPWGTDPKLGLGAAAGGGTRPGAVNPASTAHDIRFKDPQIANSDAWRFPTNSPLDKTVPNARKFAGVGELGQVHRGTPWQTVYWKADAPAVGTSADLFTAAKSWYSWNGNPWNHPTNDWKLPDLFTTAFNDNSARGLVGVGQTNIAAWSALLSGVAVFDNRGSSGAAQLGFLSPNSAELRAVVGGYTNAYGEIVPGVIQIATNPIAAPNGRPAGLGSILAARSLASAPPFLNMPPYSRVVDGWAGVTNLTDEVLERLPQQILSLMRADEPRVTIYSFGQTLKPALNSLVTKPGRYFGMATNYQITGDFATKTVLRFDGYTNNLAPVIEDHRVLFPVD